MRFGDSSVTQILIGLNQAGIVGLDHALRRVRDSGERGREAVVDLLLQILRLDNYIPEHRIEAYRTALWREYLRHTGQDFSAYYSEIPVTVRGTAGADRDRFVALVDAVLAKHELQPVVTYAGEDEGLSSVELVIRGTAVARSSQDRESVEKAIREYLSDT